MHDGSNFGLALSGGGFRATFFHLGVIRLLRESGVLQQVRHICSVSGGSILAAHMVQNWARYNGSDEAFDTVTRELVSFAQSDVRGRIVRRWWLSRLVSTYKRTALLQSYYSRLLAGADLSALGDEKAENKPELHIITTSMTTGQLCSFNRKGFWVERGGESVLLPCTLLPLGLAVAASSAFPPLFPPVALTRHMLDVPVNELPYKCDYLADGGVFDNLGIRKFHDLRARMSLRLDLLLISDAGSAFDWDVESRFGWLPSRTTRATDILMKRVGDLEQDLAIQGRGSAEQPIVRIGIDAVATRSDQSNCLREDIQKKIRMIRTDLDTFRNVEIDSLVMHGYCVAYKSLKTNANTSKKDIVFPDATVPIWTPCRSNLLSAASIANILNRSRRRSIGLWNPGDWMSWAGLACVAMLGFVAALPYLQQRQQLVAAQNVVTAGIMLSNPHSREILITRLQARPAFPDEVANLILDDLKLEKSDANRASVRSDIIAPYIESGVLEYVTAAGPDKGKLRLVRQPNFATALPFYCTDRNRIGGSTGPEQFGNGFAELTCGVAQVSIPREHRMGVMERPNFLRLEFKEDPERYVVVNGRTGAAGARFRPTSSTEEGAGEQ